MTVLAAISGTHSTGKTTLCNTLYDIGTDMGLDVCLLQESARVIFDQCNVVPGDTTDMRKLCVVQARMLMHQYHAECEALECDYDVVICDRCVWDMVVYSRVYGITPSVLQFLEDIARCWVGRYDYIALTEINTSLSQTVGDDGLRDVSTTLWYDVDAAMHEAIYPNIATEDLPRIFDPAYIPNGGNPYVS